jgi:hypothetical protein
MGIEQLVGETLVEVRGLKEGSDRVEFVTKSGKTFVMLHTQDCCENVNIEDISGTVDVILDSPIVRATEDINKDHVHVVDEEDWYYESCTWTFYNISTAKGTVTIRWLGTSNGYYSESVDFEEITH